MIFPKVIKKIKIRSFTNKSEFYIVGVWNNGKFSCKCPAFQFNPKTHCKHIKKVIKYLKKEKIKQTL